MINPFQSQNSPLDQENPLTGISQSKIQKLDMDWKELIKAFWTLFN